MIRTIHTLTLKDYSRHIETGDNRYLCEPHRKGGWRTTLKIYIALHTHLKQIEALKTEILELFQTDITNDLRSAVGKMQLWNTIVQMDCLLKAIRVHLVDKVELDLLAGVNTIDEGLMKLLDIARELFNTEIKTLDDIQPLFDHLQFRIDKFEELYPKVEAAKPMPFTSQYQQVFLFLEMPPNNMTTLSEFASLRLLALEKSKQLEAINEKYKNHAGT